MAHGTWMCNSIMVFIRLFLNVTWGLHLVNISHSTYDHGILTNTLNFERYWPKHFFVETPSQYLKPPPHPFLYLNPYKPPFPPPCNSKRQCSLLKYDRRLRASLYRSSPSIPCWNIVTSKNILYVSSLVPNGPTRRTTCIILYPDASNQKN